MLMGVADENIAVWLKLYNSEYTRHSKWLTAWYVHYISIMLLYRVLTSDLSKNEWKGMFARRDL